MREGTLRVRQSGRATGVEVRVLGEAQFARLQAVRADRDPGRLFAGYLARDLDPTNTNHWEAAR